MADRTKDADRADPRRKSSERPDAAAVTQDEVAADLAIGEAVPEGARIATLLLSDLVGSSALVQRTGDAVSAELFRKHDRLARDLLEQHGGREIDKTDGFLLLFDRPWQAVLYALDYHRALAELSEAEGVELESRVGIHLGEILLRRNPPQDVARGAKPIEVEGLAKPTAARLMSVAGGGQTLMTHGAFDLARRSATGSARSVESLRWLAHGSYLFKGVEEPVEVFEVGVEGVAPLTAPESSEKVTRAADEDTILGWRPAPGLQVPQRPNWTLAEKLGEGGFGEVWLGEHGKTGEHRVYKFCYEADRLLSLQREITVFRLLKEELGLRDDIARILDWNLDEAPYFIEFVYIEGGSLVAWAEAQGGIGEVPMADRLEIVAQVATALAAAHSVGVLHKDVKPANILMTTDQDGRPRAVLTDFGIGLITDRERLAARGITVLGLTEKDFDSTGGSTAGTQIYMAPELLAGQPFTTQADVYALGVMLYQMVLGDLGRPLAQGWQRRVEDRLLREDIAALVDGSPARRLGSAAEVAERLRNLEQRRAARAAEQSAARAAAKARRRRKVLTTVASVSSVFLVVVSFLAIQSMRAHADAELRRGQAEELIDFMLNDLHEGLDKIGRLDLLSGVAQSSKRYFDSLSERDQSPDDLHKRGLTLLNVGHVLLDQGDTEAALATQRSAVALFEEATARDPAREDWQRGLVHSRLGLGQVLHDRGDSEAARQAFGAAVETADRLAARGSGDGESRFALARALYELGAFEGRLGELAAAAETLGRALEMAEELTTSVGGDVDWRRWELLVEAQVLLAGVHRFRDELAPAADLYGQARLLAARLTDEDPANATWPRQLARIHYQIGAVQLEQRDLEASIGSFRAANVAYQELTRTDPTRVRWRAYQAESLGMIGLVLDARGEPDAALEIYRQSRQLLERIVEDDPTRLSWLEWLARIHISTGDVHLGRRDLGAALESYEAARSLRARVARSAAADAGPLNALAYTLVQIGTVHARRDQPVVARQAWTRAVEIIEPVTAASDVPSYLDTHVQALLLLDRLEEATGMVEELLAQGWDDPLFLELVREKGLMPGETAAIP